MKTLRQIFVAFTAIFLLAACTDRAKDAVDRANADAERARDIAIEAGDVAVQIRLKFYSVNRGEVRRMMEARRVSSIVSEVEFAAHRALAAYKMAQTAVRKATHAAENGLTDRAIEAAFDAAESVISATAARDDVFRKRNQVLRLIRQSGGDPDN
ncbi:MAG: hypothetical protein MPK10_08675 [Gammaproteobacteria bacterium]|nr:hypothetical protein [Gammaproteobacteria bacterium]MDA7961885.1 hypothetical protein [Gammaproteobacteria bacterium]MDA7972620.1 hypothetical protein [Gammaproteobacteria bacterium]MDA7994909.1 hypothetical protein [Gammaproteobacteria bacterium]MDA8023338.1 hypothetical protein [Gammaproteobacteria bacterium]